MSDCVCVCANAYFPRSPIIPFMESNLRRAKNLCGNIPTKSSFMGKEEEEKDDEC